MAATWETLPRAPLDPAVVSHWKGAQVDMSNAKTQTLEPLLRDVGEVNEAHRNLRTGSQGRQWYLDGLNRSAIVLTVSAWEAYVEDLAIECVDLIRPPAQAPATQPWPMDAWPAINAATRTAIGR